MAKNKYKSITKYLELFDREGFGKWESRDGSDAGMIMPVFGYDSDVLALFRECKDLLDERESGEYFRVMETDISELSEQELVLRLWGYFRQERFHDGLINSLMEDGTIQNILHRLRYLDSQED